MEEVINDGLNILWKIIKKYFHRGQDRFKRTHETTDILLPPPPLNLAIRKGYKNVALTRVDTTRMVNDQLAISLQNWLEDTWIPDEHFYSTLATVVSYNFRVR